MKPRLDHVGLDVSDYERSKAFYEKALAPLGMRLLMEPVPNVGGFGGDFPLFWIAKRERGPDSGVHVAFTTEDRETLMPSTPPRSRPSATPPFSRSRRSRWRASQSSRSSCRRT